MKIVGSSSSIFSMQIYYCFLVLAILFLAVTRSSCSVADHHDDSSSSRINRTSFPTNFIFGTASSSYQYEGAANEDGRGPSIWDTWTHKFPEKINDRSNGDVAVDSYHRYKEDVGIMKEMGLDAYRFSISWSRLLPNGTLSGGVNAQGVTYYNNLINELLSKGLQPFITLFHWDLPQPLEDEYGGFLSPRIVDDFKDYAELCYKEFGDRVKYWITFNEPWTYSTLSYAVGQFAPGRCSKWVGNCTLGNSGTEPYTVAHHQLLAHAVAAKLYKDNYQMTQKGNIGITLASHWMVPISSSKANQAAAFRALDFMYGWFMDPLTYGEYPQSMRSLVGDRLPKFSEDESKLVKGSSDFIGLNYYTANYVEHARTSNNFTNVIPSYTNDAQTKLTTQRNGIPIGAKSASPWLYIYPQGFRNLLHYTKTKYKNPVIYITENGISDPNDPNITLEEALKDDQRIMYYDHHLFYLQKAIKEGVDVRGYFAWSLLDNFEWASGYTVRCIINKMGSFLQVFLIFAWRILSNLKLPARFGSLQARKLHIKAFKENLKKFGRVLSNTRGAPMDRGKSFPNRLMYPLIFLLFLVNVLTTVSGAKNVTAQNINREDFPANFLFGVATVAYQNEGATKEGGRGKTTWDTFAETYKWFIAGNANADLAVDSYHRYKEDVKLAKEMGMNSFRFSIAWTRILPGGHLSNGVNEIGVAYYNSLINELLANGIEPFVTLWHFDVPQVLEDEYNSFLSPKFVDDYKDLVDVCFKEFGDRVKHWITFNEPWTLVWGGYAQGLMPPKRCSNRTWCSSGDSGTEPYIVGHNLLLAHAAAVDLYKEKYQASQKGIIGITLNTDWMVPASNKTEDALATRRGLDFNLGWFLDPLTNGHYPETMVNILKDRLPAFTPEELKKIKGSFDFIGLNYYSTLCITNKPPTNATQKNYLEDPQVEHGYTRDGVSIGEQAGIVWQHVYPQGFREILNFIKKEYQSPVIYITENGYSTNTTTESFKEAIEDVKRVDFYSQHLYQLQQAIKDGVDVRGYFAWTLKDNFEWASAYDIAFGLYHVDRINGLKVYPKDSSKWFTNFLQNSIKINVEL